MDPLTVRTDDGLHLRVARIGASGPPRATVLAVHAMMADARTLDRPAGAGLGAALAAHGLEVWLADLRGHGGSDRPGTWTYDELVRRDLPALCAAAPADRPLVLLGHSLGGHVAAAALGTGRVRADAVVLLAANIWMPSLETHRRRIALKGLTLAAFLGIARLCDGFPARRLRMGPADEALPYVEDLCASWRRDAWTARDGEDYGASLGDIDVPVLQVAGRGDHLAGHIEGLRAFTGRIPGAELWLAGRDSHGLRHHPDHMGLATDPRCEPLWRAIAGWIHGALPEGAGTPDGAPR